MEEFSYNQGARAARNGSDPCPQQPGICSALAGPTKDDVREWARDCSLNACAFETMEDGSLVSNDSTRPI